MAKMQVKGNSSAKSSDAQLLQLHEMGLYLVRSMDAMKQRIASLSPTPHGGIIQYKDGKTGIVNVSHSLSSELFCDGYLIVANTRENVQTLIDAWDAALGFSMTVIFLDANSGTKWMLRPHIHAKVAEPRTLGAGILALYEHSLLG